MSTPPDRNAKTIDHDIAWWKSYTWPVIVVALLGGHVVVITGASLLSSTLIPGASVAPSGYAEALAWDELKAARQASEALGWTLIVTPTDRTEVNGDRWVTFSLQDAEHRPIIDAKLNVRLFHHSRPHQPIEATAAPLTENAGDYAAAIPLKREGTWHLEAVATQDETRFLAEADIWIGKPAQEAL